MKHVIMFSGGIGSWGAARRVVDQHGPDDVTLLFCDTLIEDADLYRFLDDAAADLGVPITRIADGRTPWQLFHDERIIGSARVAPCSSRLKQRVADRWFRDNCDPADTVRYVGIDWTEIHRLERLRKVIAPWRVEAPLCEPPYPTKASLFTELEARGIKPPRLYRLGFPHNNCGGGCVRAGQAHFAHLLKVLPDVYAEWEQQEATLRAELGNHSILRDRTDGTLKPLPLSVLRERIQAQPQTLDLFEWGGCGCFIDTDEEPA